MEGSKFDDDFAVNKRRNISGQFYPPVHEEAVKKLKTVDEPQSGTKTTPTDMEEVKFKDILSTDYLNVLGRRVNTNSKEFMKPYDEGGYRCKPVREGVHLVRKAVDDPACSGPKQVEEPLSGPEISPDFMEQVKDKDEFSTEFRNALAGWANTMSQEFMNRYDDGGSRCKLLRGGVHLVRKAVDDPACSGPKQVEDTLSGPEISPDFMEEVKDKDVFSTDFRNAFRDAVARWANAMSKEFMNRYDDGGSRCNLVRGGVHFVRKAVDDPACSGPKQVEQTLSGPEISPDFMEEVKDKDVFSTDFRNAFRDAVARWANAMSKEFMNRYDDGGSRCNLVRGGVHFVRKAVDDPACSGPKQVEQTLSGPEISLDFMEEVKHKDVFSPDLGRRVNAMSKESMNRYVEGGSRCRHVRGGVYFVRKAVDDPACSGPKQVEETLNGPEFQPLCVAMFAKKAFYDVLCFCRSTECWSRNTIGETWCPHCHGAENLVA